MTLPDINALEKVVGRSGLIRAEIERCASYSGCRSPVLIYGETGTGKEVFAKAVHAGAGMSAVGRGRRSPGACADYERNKRGSGQGDRGTCVSAGRLFSAKRIDSGIASFERPPGRHTCYRSTPDRTALFGPVFA